MCYLSALLGVSASFIHYHWGWGSSMGGGCTDLAQSPNLPNLQPDPLASTVTPLQSSPPPGPYMKAVVESLVG
uniref:Uncharacterized protein n=1 Tax=Knipowitschia caucasica TaxID=637954 RepID=A0AAV2MIB2_KNICA